MAAINPHKEGRGSKQDTLSVFTPETPNTLTMLCTRKFMPVPGVSHVPLSPLKPSVTAYIARSRSLLKPNLRHTCKHHIYEMPSHSGKLTCQWSMTASSKRATTRHWLCGFCTPYLSLRPLFVLHMPKVHACCELLPKFCCHKKGAKALNKVG